jgi:fermentation-respiration switch protein FrsA (DUF1100 family)
MSFHFNKSILFSKILFTALLVTLPAAYMAAQDIKKPEDFGFRYLQIKFKGDPVDILIKSAKGEEQKRKPLFLFCQGSLPVPLIIYDKKDVYGVFPFNTDSLSVYFHIVIIGKPYTPVMADVSTLRQDFTYTDSTGMFPVKYTERNLLTYYAERNLAMIDSLQKKSWVSGKKLVAAGHSEGSTIAARLASRSKKITHLIYSSGNPLGRMLTIISRNRLRETDSLQYAEADFKNWRSIVEEPGRTTGIQGDSYKTNYEFSIPPFSYLEKLTIPVLVSYGTKDIGSAPFNDYLRIEMIRRKKANFTFNAYIGTDHNFFGLKPNGETDYDKFNWDKVASDWLNWLRKN